MKYQKKPEIVDAVQIAHDGYVGYTDGGKPEWLIEPVANGVLVHRPAQSNRMNAVVHVQTPQGMKEAVSGDWVLRDAQGRISLCEAAEFENLYTPIYPVVPDGTM